MTFTSTTLWWCVIVGLLVSYATMTLVTANTRGPKLSPKEDYQIVQLSGNHNAKNHRDVPTQHVLKELFSSSKRRTSVAKNDEQRIVASSSSMSIRTLIDPDEVSTCTPEWIQAESDIDGGDAADDYFGYSVSLSADGTVLVVGAPYHDGLNGSSSYSGAVKVFTKDSSSSLGWIQLGETLYGDAAYDYAGSSVAMSADGNVIAFGAPGNDANGAASGHTKIYKRDTSTSLGWSQIGSSIVGEAAGDYSGSSIALSGDGEILAIGAPDNEGNGYASGHVRIYTRDNASSTGWSQIGEDLRGTERDGAGASVSLSSDGTIVAFGCPYSKTQYKGYVKVYKRDTSASRGWVKVGKKLDSESVDNFFGISVALSGLGDIIAIGADGSGRGKRDSSGIVRVFQQDPASSSGWSQLGGDIYGEAASDRSGNAVAISYSGDIVAIGAPGNDDGGNESGHVRVYKRDPTSELGWVQVGTDIDGESSSDWSFEPSSAVAISANGHVLASGAPANNNDNGKSSGHVRVYEMKCKNKLCIQDPKAKFYTGKTKVNKKGQVRPKKKQCKWLENAGTWKINKFCNMTDSFDLAWTSIPPASNVCFDTCNSCPLL